MTTFGAYVVPFDGVLSTDLGLSASDALAVVDRIIARFRAHVDSLGQGSTPQEAFSGYRVKRNELIAQHGKKGDAFWRMFTVGRGRQSSPIPHRAKYSRTQTIHTPFRECRFGCKLDEMLLSLLAASEACLLSGQSKATYLRHRARTLQEQTVSSMRQVLGGSARIYQNLFETPDNHNEHDIVILGDAVCLFVEVKSSPPDEPSGP